MECGKQKYQELLELGKDVAHPEDHMLGAQASRNLGRIEMTYVRIQRTLEVIERLQDDAKYAELESEARKLDYTTSFFICACKYKYQSLLSRKQGT